jgi:hypothetical protein
MIITTKNPKLVPDGADRSTGIITTFDNAPPPSYIDHMGPFRGILSQMKGAPDKEKSETISKILANKSKKLLVAATGNNTTTDIIRSISKAATLISGPNSVVLLDHIQASPWLILTMKDKKDVKKLINQQAVYDPYKQILIVFRGITMRPTDTKIFEIRDVKYNEDLDEVRKVLAEGKVEVRHKT